ncbi:hypothetical protein A2110_03030 [Candidatus Jorgensenbacteria bacterium GWA1_54_12]|uniref:Spore protein YkvP/CgeB glycosyl transferase-like domain-containing protein n=1 Tax=Candidatus Jorgensenbacteria bacterium GWA1_54_12 TaxID=1798468 RepID=A0A1F6BL96_9BACT|nr:MAG: hypothetical protein UY51_C0002G0005 [Candidatus Jorgensenbacteria bacterium GW2011_GWB1_49_9]OGG37532.1 MAG: hypothetical protein A2110_03030 [Candidatus Jorgensenbacteria bacterium GWA1_54_12]
MKPFKDIIVVGPQHPDTLPKSVLETLRDMGHNASAVDERELLGTSFRRGIEGRGRISFFTKLKKAGVEALTKNSPEFERRVYDRLASLIESKNPDLVITHSAWIPPEAIARLKRNTHAKIVLWFPDHPGNIGRQYLFASPYDALFFKDAFLVDRARSLNLNAHYLPEACMPKWHKRVELTEKEKETYGCDVTTAGNMYYYRAKVFEPLIDSYNVKIWGPDIPAWLNSSVRRAHQGKSVTELTKSKAFNAAKIVLNTFQGEVSGVNQRFFEIAGCGGFQLCEYRDAVSDFFEIGKEIAVFHDLKELTEKIDYYLAHPEERQKIADAAYARAHREHTFEQRLKKMMEIISD